MLPASYAYSMHWLQGSRQTGTYREDSASGSGSEFTSMLISACKGLAEVELDAVLQLLAGRMCDLLTLCLLGRAYMHVECQHAADTAEHTL